MNVLIKAFVDAIRINLIGNETFIISAWGGLPQVGVLLPTKQGIWR
jgi:hypothetical protein